MGPEPKEGALTGWPQGGLMGKGLHTYMYIYIQPATWHFNSMETFLKILLFGVAHRTPVALCVMPASFGLRVASGWHHGRRATHVYIYIYIHTQPHDISIQWKRFWKYCCSGGVHEHNQIKGMQLCQPHGACTQKSHAKLYVHMYINSDPSAPHAYKPSFNEKGWTHEDSNT